MLQLVDELVLKLVEHGCGFKLDTFYEIRYRQEKEVGLFYVDTESSAYKVLHFITMVQLIWKNNKSPKANCEPTAEVARYG
jgi:hypothetical protein